MQHSIQAHPRRFLALGRKLTLRQATQQGSILKAGTVGLGVALCLSCLPAEAFHETKSMNQTKKFQTTKAKQTAFNTKRVYFGVDQQIRHLVFDNNYGGNLLFKDYRQNNLFTGLRFNDYFGVEAGYQWTDRRQNWGRVTKGESIYGNVISRVGNSFTDSANNLRAMGAYLDLVGSYSVKTRLSQPVVFSLGVGVGQQKVNVENRLTGNEHVATPNLELPSSVTRISFKKTVLRVTPAVQFFLSERWGIRAKFIYENLSGSKNFSPASNMMQTFTTKIKHSYSYGLGLFWQY